MSDTSIPSGAPAPKPWIEAIHAYVPGKSAGADGRKLIKLSANENPLGTSPAALAAAAEAAAPSLYPAPVGAALCEAIGKLHGIDAARIVMGAGSDELLNLAAQGYAGPGDDVIYARFGFSVYDIAARRCGATPVIAPDAVKPAATAVRGSSDSRDDWTTALFLVLLAAAAAGIFWFNWRRAGEGGAAAIAGDARFCTKCGNALRKGDRFCSKCGKAAA